MGLAVSGGPDSLALLLLASAAVPGRIEAATVDHRLRPESADEAAMVARVCSELGVPHETLTVTLTPGNLQDRARAARYAALGAWCERRGLAALATGHQRDDQAETLLMRLNRGSGLAGLAGVRARASVPDCAATVLRPLLGWRRSDLEAVVAAAGIDPVRDPSNDDTRFDRVRIRHALAGTDWLDPSGLATSAAMLAEAESYISEAIARTCDERVHRHEDAWLFTPGPSDFEAVEIVTRLVALLGGTTSRGDAAAAVQRLRRGQNASLAGILARVEKDGRWRFSAEPPRRAG